jgi:hypothetical protein
MQRMPVPDQGGRKPAAGDRHPRRRVRGAGDLGDRARPRAQRRRQGAGPRRQPRGGHGAGELQRRAALGDRHRGRDRRASPWCACSTSRPRRRWRTATRRQLSKVIAVYDFGGGTFDVTLLRLQDQVYEVLGTAGDSFLGGDDIDERADRAHGRRCLPKLRTDVRGNELALMRLRAVAEQAKIELSRRQRALVQGRRDRLRRRRRAAQPRDRDHARSAHRQGRAADRAHLPGVRGGADAGRAERRAAIEDVVLVGGTTKIPHVREQVTQFFQRAPRTDINPEEAVAVRARRCRRCRSSASSTSARPGRNLTPMAGVPVIPPTPNPPDPGPVEPTWDDPTGGTTKQRTTAPMGTDARRAAPPAAHRRPETERHRGPRRGGRPGRRARTGTPQRARPHHQRAAPPQPRRRRCRAPDLRAPAR